MAGETDNRDVTEQEAGGQALEGSSALEQGVPSGTERAEGTESGQDFDWGTLLTEDDEQAPAVDDAPAQDEGTEAQTEGDDDAPAEPAEKAAEPEPEPEPEAEAQEPEKAAEKPEEDEQAPTQEQEAPETDWNDLREQAKKTLREKYKLSDEDRERFENNPGEALPELAANLHVQVFDAVYASIMQQLPGVMQQVQGYQEAQKSFTQRFHDTWPQLKGKDQTVRQFIQTLRQVDPKMTEDKLIKQAGIQASAFLGLPIEPAGAQQSQQPAQQASEQQQGPPAGYKPVRPSGAATAPPSGQPANVWEEIISIDD